MTYSDDRDHIEDFLSGSGISRHAAGPHADASSDQDPLRGAPSGSDASTDPGASDGVTLVIPDTDDILPPPPSARPSPTTPGPHATERPLPAAFASHTFSIRGAAPAGPPPVRVVVSAYLCGLLALPMVMLAGMALARATAGSVVAGFLMLAALGVAVAALVGAVSMTNRGAMALVRIAGCAMLAVTAWYLVPLIAARLRGEAVGLTAMVFSMLLALFGGAAATMLILLATPRSRRWLAARRRERLIERRATTGR